MNQRNFGLIIGGMSLFILLHLILNTFGFFQNSENAITSLLGGFSLSIVHDSLSTRNPALEEVWFILADLPGAYSFYFSQIIINPPPVASLNESIAQWSNFDSYSNRTSQNPEIIFYFLILAFFLCIYFVLRLEKEFMSSDSNEIQ